MLKFYKSKEKMQTVSAQLSWSHYCELLTLESIEKIDYYIMISEKQHLSVRQLREKIKSNEYERLPENSKVYRTDQGGSIMFEVNNKLIKSEIYDKAKDYSNDRHKVSVNFEIEKLLGEAGKKYGKNIMKYLGTKNCAHWVQN